MKIQVLTAAINDLNNGRLFYQQQGEHLGDYFLDSLFSDIDSLIVYAGIHQQVFGYYRMLAHRFPLCDLLQNAQARCSRGMACFRYAGQAREDG